MATPAYQPLPYRPDGGIVFRHLPKYVGMLLLVGLVMGAWQGLSRQAAYFLFITPAISCLALGVTAVYAARWAILRNRIAACSLAGMAGVFAALIDHYIDFLCFVLALPAGAIPLGEWVSLQPTAYVRFLNARADMGKKFVSSSRPALVFGPDGTRILWAVEALWLAGSGAAGAWIGASKPYCRDCNRYMAANIVGNFHTYYAKEFFRSLQTGDVTQIAMIDRGCGTSRLVATLYTCSCERLGIVVIELHEFVLSQQGREGTLRHRRYIYPQLARGELSGAFARSF